MSSDYKKFYTWVEIDLKALKHNIRQVKKLLPKDTKVMAVVKSNAYGHGMVEIAKASLRFGAKWLGVVNLEEVLKLRKAKIKAPVFILSYGCKDEQDARQIVKNNFSIGIYDLKTAKLLSDIAMKLKKKAKVHIKIDTGTSRLGVLTKDAVSFTKKVKALSGIKIEGIFTHFAASESDKVYTKKQIKDFKSVLDQLEKENIRISLKHTACSAASFLYPDSHFNMIRFGISLYGLWPSKQTKRLVQKKRKNFDLKPVLTWKTKIIQIKELPKGTSIGYDCTYRTKRKTRLAVLPMGYWEGYDRLLSNNSEALTRGERAKVLGRVCMNLTMIDVTDIKNAKVGDEVVLLGKQKNQEISAEEIAEKIDTINYEVVTRINPLLPRIYFH